jgi:hypothetical protein
MKKGILIATLLIFLMGASLFAIFYLKESRHDLRKFVTPYDPLVQQTLKDIKQHKPFFMSDSNAIRNWIATNIKYEKDSTGHPQYPAETIRLKQGDCEDFAFLLCSLLRADGYSPEQAWVAISSSRRHAFVLLQGKEGYRVIESEAPGRIFGLLGVIEDINEFGWQYRLQELTNSRIDFLFNDEYFQKVAQ